MEKTPIRVNTLQELHDLIQKECFELSKGFTNPIDGLITPVVAYIKVFENIIFFDFFDDEKIKLFILDKSKNLTYEVNDGDTIRSVVEYLKDAIELGISVKNFPKNHSTMIGAYHVYLERLLIYFEKLSG